MSPVELRKQAPSSHVETPAPTDQGLPSNPVQEPTRDYEKRLWDTLVNRTDTVGSHPGDAPLTSDGDPLDDGPAVEAEEARRMSPYHQNPEETTMEEQLEAVRQQSVNYDESQSMSSTEPSRGDERIRGEYAHASGKGWNGYNDLPSDKSWA